MIAFLLLAAPLQARYDVLRAGEPIGEATMRLEIAPNGDKLTELRLTLGGTVVRQSSRTAPDGRPLRRYQDLRVPGSPPRFIIAEFPEGRTKLVQEEQGIRTLSEVALPEGAPAWANPSEFWFMRDRPVKGESVEFSDLDLNAKAWRTLRTTYLGQTKPRGLPLVHKMISKTLVEDRERLVTVYAGDDGLPWRIEDTGGLTLERLRTMPIK